MEHNLDGYGKMNFGAWVARFWGKCRLHDASACWPWQGSRDLAGYGRVYRGRFFKAHRVAFYLTYGRWPNVCRHACDNPPCCNPAHLEDGTHADNVHDAQDRGRMPSRPRGPAAPLGARGARNGAAKLDEALVLELRRRHAAGEGVKPLAREAGVAPSTLRAALRGRTWR